MNSFSIIGAGRVGASLGCALIEKGFKIEAFSCRNRSSLEESHRLLREGMPSTDNIQTAGQVEIVIISVPDDEIKNVCEELASSHLTWKKRLVIHCSGLLSSQILEPLKEKVHGPHQLILYIPSRKKALPPRSLKVFISDWKARKRA